MKRMVGPIALKRFRLDSIKDNSTICAIGKRRSGKSVLMKDIMWHKRHLPVGVAMSPTEKANRYFRDFMPDVCIYDDFNLTAIESILTRQERICDAIERKETKGLPKDPTAFIVADDCMYDKKNWKTTAIRNCFMNGRHWHLFFMFSMQYCVDIPPDLRTNLDYVFVFRESVMEQKEKLFKYFFGMFENKKEFIKIFDDTATGFDFIALDLTQGSNEKEDCVMWGRAAPREAPFRVGHPRLWWFAGEFARHGTAMPSAAAAAAASASVVAASAPQKSIESSKKKSDPQRKRDVDMGMGKDMKRANVIKLGDDDEMNNNNNNNKSARQQPTPAPAPAPAPAPVEQQQQHRQQQMHVSQQPQTQTQLVSSNKRQRVPDGVYRPPSPFSNSRHKRQKR